VRQIRFKTPYETIWSNTLLGLTVDDYASDEKVCRFLRMQQGHFSAETIEKMCDDVIAGNYHGIDNLEVEWIY